MKPSSLRALTLASALAFLLTACGNEQESGQIQTPLRPVKTITVAPPSQNQWRELPGVVDSARKAELNFRVSGKLDKMLVNEGDEVKKDQLLAQLDQTDLKIQLNSRQAEYNQVHADYTRSTALVKKGVISRSEYNKLQAQEVTAKSNLKTAQQNLKYTSLNAPFAGQIAKRHVENFEEVSGSQSIYSLQDPSTLTIKIAVPESMVIRGKRDKQPTLSAEFEAIPGKRFPLEIKETATQADPESNTFEVTLSMLDIDGHNILPGMSVTVRGERKISSDDPQSKFVFVPAQAVLEDTAGRYVYVVTPAGKGIGTVERRDVSTGQLSSMGLEIKSGLETGTHIVIAGMSKMYPGLEVRTDLEAAQ